jgi:hypothetical protein
MGFEKAIEAVITIFILVVFVSALTPALSQINFWSGLIFAIAGVLIIAAIILSFFKR